MKKRSLGFLLLAGCLVAGMLLIDRDLPQPANTAATNGAVWADTAVDPEAGSAPKGATKEANGAGAEVKPEHPERFVEYYNQIRTPVGKSRPDYPPNYRMIELQKARQRAIGKTNPAAAVTWTERGPANVGGRTRAIVVDLAADPAGNTWFAGSVGGGIWKTTDAGLSWRNLTPELPNLATVSLAQGTSDPNVMYAGTGEGFGNGDAVDGDGIFRSADRGETWMQLPVTAGNRDFSDVNRLIVDPANPAIVVAATNTGIFRSQTGGFTWDEALNVGIGFRAQHVVAMPGNFDVQLAAINSAGIWRSTNGGATWARVFQAPDTGRRIELAIAPSNPNRIYAAIERGATNDNTGRDVAALFMSNDGGTTWQLVTPVGGDPNWLGDQGWYDNSIAVHPFDEDVVFVGGINMWRVDVNPGALTRTIEQVTNWYPGLPNGPGTTYPYVHADHHNLTAVVLNQQAQAFRFIDGSDGGVAFSDDAGASWDWRIGGYNTGQFYGVDKRPGAEQFIGGMQDNGTWFSPDGISSDATTEWNNLLGGDGFDAVWHHGDPSKLIGTVQYNAIYRSLDGGMTGDAATDGYNDDGNFITTVAQSDSDPDLLITTGVGYIWRSDNFAGGWTQSRMSEREDRWNPGNFPSNTRAPAAISLADPRVVWAGYLMSAVGRAYVSTDGGVTFDPVAPANGVGAYITGIGTDPLDAQTAYLTFGTGRHIIRTTDLGQSWSWITPPGSGFPDVATYCVLVMPFDTDVLWAGTEIGIFISNDGGQSWNIAEGFPAVSVWEMRIVDGEVVIATHGRGVWTASVPELAGYQPPQVTLAPRLERAILDPTGVLGIDVTLRSAYDSTTVFVDGQPVAHFGSTAGSETRSVDYPVQVESPRIAEVSVQSYQQGEAYLSGIEEVTLFNLTAPQVRFSYDFEADNGQFFGEGFSIEQQAGFSSGALHSAHPYDDRTTVSYQLLQPIEVATGDAVLRYRDVALVEPAEPQAVFGDQEFWDYVVVEGTTDGAHWVPLADGYDAGLNDQWRSAYDQGQGGSEGLFVQHTVNLLDTFAPGDVIFIRFRLFADAGVNGWGWAVDDLEIQPNAPVATEDDVLPDGFALEQNYPNPFNPTTTIPFTVGQAGPVTIKVYDVQGRLVSTLADGVYAPGQYHVAWNADRFASGTYFYTLEAGSVKVSKTLTLVK